MFYKCEAVERRAVLGNSSTLDAIDASYGVAAPGIPDATAYMVDLVPDSTDITQSTPGWDVNIIGMMAKTTGATRSIRSNSDPPRTTALVPIGCSYRRRGRGLPNRAGCRWWCLGLGRPAAQRQPSERVNGATRKIQCSHHSFVECSPHPPSPAAELRAPCARRRTRRPIEPRFIAQDTPADVRPARKCDPQPPRRGNKRR